MMMARVLLRSVARRGSSIVPRRNFSSFPTITNELKGFVAYAKHNRIVNAMCFGGCLYTVPECFRLSGEILEKIKSREELHKSGLDQAETQVPRQLPCDQ